MAMTWILKMFSKQGKNSSITFKTTNPVNATIIIKKSKSSLHNIVKHYCDTSDSETTAKRVAKYNNISTPNNLKKGQKIQIPQTIIKRRIIRSFSK